MAKVQTPYEKVGKAPVMKNTTKKPPPQRSKKVYCVLCRRWYLKHEAQEHMHSLQHHRELDSVLDMNSSHNCQACKESSMGLQAYAQHITTAQHVAKLKSLVSKNVKPYPLTMTVDSETMSRIQERNKALKKKEKKAMKKKKKKLKQLAGQERVEKLKGATRKIMVMSKVVKLENNNQEGSKHAVFQNKENKVSSLQRRPHPRESAQNQSERLACLSGEPAGWTLHHTYFRDQFSQSAHQLKNDDNFAVNSQCSKLKGESSERDRLVKRPQSTQRGATNTPGQTSWPAISQLDRSNRQFDNETDFTSDQLPWNGAIIFDSQNERMEQEGSHCSAQTVSVNKSAKEAPIQDVDVSAMLRQIRRALGVREPCRADREAKKQSSEAGARVADQDGPQEEPPADVSFRNDAREAARHITSAATTSVHSSQVSSPVPASHSHVSPSNNAPAKPKQTVEVTQTTTEHCGKSPVVERDSNGPSNSRGEGSQGATNSQMSISPSSDRTTSSEPNQNISRKVRIAHEPSRLYREKESSLKPTLNKLLSSSGAKGKLSWREMFEQTRRKKLETGKGAPRFGIELSNPMSGQESSTQAQDLPLSEGFHWESLPHIPSGAYCTEPPPPAPVTADHDSHTETQSDSRPQRLPERHGAAQEAYSSRTVKASSVKVEPNSEEENEDLSDHSGAKKRKREEVMHESISDTEPTGKKKTTKSNKAQDQMDQLLAVSLREDELSHSLQDLDKSLVQARNALQAAYAELQRLLILKQQFTAEVNSLRAKRIEILQGMQGGYSGSSNAEKASTSSARAAAAMQPRHSPLPSSSAFNTASNQQPAPTSQTLSISQPHPAPLTQPNMQGRTEVHQPLAVSCNTVPVTQPLPLFPSDLLPSLLLTSPHLAAPAAAVTSLKHMQTQSSASARFSPEPSVRQREQVMWDGLKDCIQAARLARDEANSEGTGGNFSPTAEKNVSASVPESEQNAAAVESDDGGNESDDSDDSVEMMEPSNLVVIDINESDNEEAVSTVPVQQEPPQKSVSVEFSSAGTQTFQQPEDERKNQFPVVPVKEASAPPECVQGVVEDEEPSLGAFANHSGPVHSLQIHEGLLYTCSWDNTARAYSLTSRECQAVFKGHTNKVNCLLVSSVPNMPTCLFTGSSDQTICCYSIKSQKCLEQISLSDRVLCLHVAWNILFAGLANGSVARFDLKTLKQLDVFECHGPRGVSCLGTAQEGARRVLLVGSYDSTISVRDAKSGLLLRSLESHTKTVLCMKVVNDLVFSGSSDASVHAHNIHTGELVRIYKGHGHAVTSIVILGKVMVTACLDKLVRVYELQSHDRLQVYGGHSDMVVCMAIHKSVIYTGCYDGSIQAVKLNLMKNYRCWWQNCSLIFGIAEHLLQHLVRDHSNPNLQTVKCHWRGCSTFFPTQQTIEQRLPEHMQNHVENDSKVQP